MKYIITSLPVFFMLILVIPNVSAENSIPSWIKNNAGWWSNDNITENEFLTGIEYLINNDIIVITNSPDSERSEFFIDFSYTNLVPDWIKNNAGWWADGQIDDNSFVSGIQWLISNNIIKMESEKNSNQSADSITFASGVNIIYLDEIVFYYSDFFNIFCFNDSVNYQMQQGNLTPVCS